MAGLVALDSHYGVICSPLRSLLLSIANSPLHRRPVLRPHSAKARFPGTIQPEYALSMVPVRR